MTKEDIIKQMVLNKAKELDIEIKKMRWVETIFYFYVETPSKRDLLMNSLSFPGYEITASITTEEVFYITRMEFSDD